MPKPERTQSHILEERSRLYIRQNVPIEWIVRDVHYDYGLDMNIEIVEDNRVTGYNFSVQLKATSCTNSDKFVPIRLKSSTIEYMRTRLEPILIIVFVLDENEAYYLWLKDIAIHNYSAQKTYQIKVPKSNKISEVSWNYIANHVKQVFGDKLNLASPEADTDRFGRYSVDISGLSRFSERDIFNLEILINSPYTKEFEIQRFLENHSQVFLGGEYSRLHAQLKLKSDTQTLLPDFFMESVTGFCDILEIKLPRIKLIAGRKDRFRHTFKVSSAISQTQTYRDFFENDKNRRWFERRYKLIVFRPRTIVLAGRDSALEYKLQQKRLESNFRDFKLFTYDDLVRIAKNNLGKFKA